MSELNYAARTIHKTDNIHALRRTNSECIDLVYLDPPFNTGREFSRPTGEADFDDRWSIEKDEGKSDRAELRRSDFGHLDKIIKVIAEGKADRSYMRFMSIRLIEIHRILKPTGTMVLHCDDKMDSQLRIICDHIFGRSHFQNEIIWQRSKSKGNATRKLVRSGDRLLVYVKSEDGYFKMPYAKLTAASKKRFKFNDKDGRGAYEANNLANPANRPNLRYEYKGYQPPLNGWLVSRETMEQLDKDNRLVFPKSKTGRIRKKRYLSESKGVPINDIWTDIGMVQNPVYKTEKPVELLERIIETYCPPHGIVFDPFCGCATACVAAEKLERKWIGADLGRNAELAIADRLRFINDDAKVRERAKVRQKRNDPAEDLADKREAQGYLLMSGVGRSYWKKSKLIYVDPRGNDHEERLIDRTDYPRLSDKDKLDILWGKHRGKCAICDEMVDEGGERNRRPSVDHITPQDRGGTDEISNLQLAHFGCNSRKRNNPQKVAA